MAVQGVSRLLGLSIMTIVAAPGCWPTLPNCAVQCGANDLCPDETACGTDGFCHTSATIDQDCTVAIDGSVPPDSFSTCTPPILLVAVQDLTQQAVGRVLRFSIRNDGVTRCVGDLTGKDTLPTDPRALAWVPPDKVAVLSEQQIHLLDVQTNEQEWAAPISNSFGIPIDATLIGTDTPSLLVGLLSKTSSDLRFLETHRLDTGAFVDATTLTTTGLARMTRNARDPSRMLTLKPGAFAAAEIDPVTGDLQASPLVAEQPDTTLRTINSLFAPPVVLAWTGRQAADPRDGVFYFRDELGFLGPVRCDTSDRTYVDAVLNPDRSVGTRFFAITETPAGREVMHFASTGGFCDSIVEDASLRAGARISALAVVEAL
ncbi:MAG: hypothetical protein H6Q90_2667 [Deltaproteobacteria bacterium]|nr:hypothetical protein [Deltaproteobacteria bacterium]